MALSASVQGFLGIWAMMLSFGTIARVFSSDLETLKSLSEELKGAGSLWDTTDNNPCNWEGVHCNGVSVTNITLQSLHLKGTISPSIGLLQALNSLDLSKNSLFDQIPANISNCRNLSILNLSANRLSGSIPADLHKLSSLEVLDLSANTLNGSIPDVLGNLSHLQSLNLAFNSLTGTIPPGFGNLWALEALSVSQNLLEGRIAQVVYNLSNLKAFSAYQNSFSGPMPQLNWESLLRVNLASNNLSGEIPENICASKQLKVLILTSNSFNGTLPAGLGSCHALTTLRVGHNLFSGELPAGVGKLESLIYFEADQNLLTGHIPAGMSGCKNLALLNLADNSLSGIIPEELGNVSTLQELRLSKNSFFGGIPQGLSHCKLLSLLDLSENNLFGCIPPDLCNIDKLMYLRLHGNTLAGEIPASIGNFQQLLELQLGDNGFNGTIPSTLGSLTNLQVLLNLSANHLTGTIPDSIGILSKLVSLDLSHNELSGRIPSLVNMISLVDWSFSYNFLSGPVPQVGSVLNSSSSDYASSYAHNPGLCGGPLSPCDDNAPKAKRRAVSFWHAAGITVACVIVVLVILSGIVITVMYKHHMSSAVDPAPSLMVSRIFVKCLEHAVNFDTVKEVTQTEGNVISGNHFSTMYKAVMPSGLILAAKKFHSVEKGLVFHYRKIAFDLDKTWRLSHENVMQPIGYLLQENFAIILYDFVPLCSLGQQLHKSCEQVLLTWSMRYQIAIGAAQGLAFMHHSCYPPMVHMDVNSHNIFLGLHSEVKLGDIEVAKLLDPSKITGSISAVAGSFGYIAPEYAFTMQVTLPSNVYSFGVVLLELLTGRLPIDEMFGDGVDLVRWVHEASARGETPEQILDARISTHSFASRQEMLAVLKVALLCTNASPLKRPRMKKVLEMLLESKRPAESLSIAYRHIPCTCHP